MLDLEHDSNVRWEVETFTIGQREQFIVVQHTVIALDGRIIHPILECLPIQVLDPFRIDIAIKDDPVSLTAFTTDVINNLAQGVGEQPVAPFTRRGIERAIQCVFVHGLGVNDIGNSQDCSCAAKTA
jgi:hypothetical protein